MSDIEISSQSLPQAAFRNRSVLIIMAIGILSFGAMLVLGAYAPDLRSGRNGGSHGLSNAATGFSGLVRLAEATGRNPVIVRSDRLLDSEDLALLTPERGRVSLEKILTLRATKPTLVILPKWETSPSDKQSGWVSTKGLIKRYKPEGVLAPSWRLNVRRNQGIGKLRTVVPAASPALQFSAPRPLQTISGKGLFPVITDQQGNIVLAKLGIAPLYVLADPDLLSNKGMADAKQAAAALALLDYLNSTGASSILFDVTLNGLGHSPSPLRLAFDPPFLATTLAILAALLLVSVQAANRFGPVRRRERALAFGKAALIDNAAALVRKAGRESAFGARYAAMLRERAIAKFHVPPRLRDTAVDQYLDRIEPRRPFSSLATATSEARRSDELLVAARELHSWPQEKVA